MIDLEYYKYKDNKYLGTIDLSEFKSKKTDQDSILICLLDRSGSMHGNVYIFVKEIFPLVLEKLQTDKQDNILITYDDAAEKFTGNAEYFRNQEIKSKGDNILYLGLTELEKIFDEYINSNTKKSIRLLTISDGDVGNVSDVIKKVEELIKKINNNFLVNSHAVRYFTSSSPPETRGLASVLKLNNVTTGKLIDIKAEDAHETNATKIAQLFLDDGLNEIYKIISEEKNLYENPWSEPSSEILLKKGKNFIWFENIEKLKINDLNNTNLEANKQLKGEINAKNYTTILNEKFNEIKQKAIILKILNKTESNNELTTLMNNIENFEKEINKNTSNTNSLFYNLKKINETDYQNQNADELAESLQKIDFDYKKENDLLKKNIKEKDFFLCPQCNKNIPLFISFKEDQNKNIFVNYLCLCNKKQTSIKLEDLLNNWSEIKQKSSNCNSHSNEGKYCLKCNRWLCDECIIVHDDLIDNHKNMIINNELNLNSKCEEHNKKNNIGFCCSCYSEICSKCAGFYHDGHVKYTNRDKWKDLFESLDFRTISEFDKIVEKMNKKLLKYKNDQIQKLNNIINEISNLIREIENKYQKLEKNNKNLTNYYKNMLKTFIVFEEIPSFILNENVSKFQFNKNFFIVENESNQTFKEIARATLETFNTFNLYQLMYYPPIKIDDYLYEIETKNNYISSIIQLKDGTILSGHYNNKKVLFYDYNYKKLESEITTSGYVSSLCELNDNKLAIGMYNPNNILIYDISDKENGSLKEIKTLEGHSGKVNTIIEIGDSKKNKKEYIVSGGEGSYELFFWDKSNNYNLEKISSHSSNINCLINLNQNEYAFASCSDDSYIKIWNCTSVNSNINVGNAVKSIVQLNNRKIASVDNGKNICIFNENNYSKEKTISSKHSSNINKIINLKDSRLITCSDDKKLNIFVPDNYKCLNYGYNFTLNNDCQIKTLMQTQNYQIISGDSNGFLKVWTPQNLGNCTINFNRNSYYYLFNGSDLINNDEKETVSKWIEPDKKIKETELLYKLTRD